MIIDVTRLTGRFLSDRYPTGIDRVDIEYVRYYHASSIALIRYRDKWLFFPSDRSKVIFHILMTQDKKAKWKIRKYVFFSYCNILTAFLPTDKRLLNISHNGLDDINYRKNIKRWGLEPIYFIHDLIPIMYPEYARVGEAKRHQNRLETVFETAKGIIVNSYDTKKILERYAQKENYPLLNSIVAHLGVTPLPNSREKEFLNQKYYVVLGTIEGRKNHILLLNLWRDMVRELGENTPILLIIGQRGWKCENVIDMLERCDTIRPYVIEKPKCSDVELFGWLQHAQALLFPSFTEGYGMPIAEALSSGIPVIASDLTVFREIAGDIPEYINPMDGIGWKNLIIEYARSDSKMREKQLFRIKSFLPVSWKNHFNVVAPFIDAIE